MNENFRLLEYKRKKYIENSKMKSKSRSPSPPKRSLSPGSAEFKDELAVAAEPKNFLTTLYRSSDLH